MRKDIQSETTNNTMESRTLLNGFLREPIRIPFKEVVVQSQYTKVGLISFSGGETSAFMLWWLLKNKTNEYFFEIVFANTGRENEATLIFVKKCAELFNCKVVFIESNVWGSVGSNTKHKVVDFNTCTRNSDWRVRRDTPYEQMCIKYGLASISNRFSTRELKDRPIQSYMRSLGYSDLDYEIMIGIRADEMDRMNFIEERIFVYPLIKWLRWTKKHINFWWSQMAFRLELKGWAGNCMMCYKKQLEKIVKIYIDDPWKLDFEIYLEFMYEYHIPESRIRAMVAKLKPIPKGPFRIFRDNTSTSQIVEKSRNFSKQVIDDSLDNTIQNVLFQESESCEVFSSCGS